MYMSKPTLQRKREAQDPIKTVIEYPCSYKL